MLRLQVVSPACGAYCIDSQWFWRRLEIVVNFNPRVQPLDRNSPNSADLFRFLRIRSKRIWDDLDKVIKEIKVALEESGKEPPYPVVL